MVRLPLSRGIIVRPGGLIAGGQEKDDMVTTMLTPRFEANEPRTLPRTLKWKPSHTAVWFDLRPAQNNGLEFWQTIKNAIIVYASMPVCWSVKSGHKRGQRVILLHIQLQTGGEDSVRKERISMRLQPVVDQRFGGISEERATTLSILEFYSAIHESHRVTAADPSAPSSCADSQADAHSLARRNPSRQETWQSWWWSDDSKWNTWSCWSQDDWRETESSSQFMFTILEKGISHQRWQSSSDRREV